MSYRIVLPVLILSLSTNCFGEQNTLSDYELRSGWKLLFDGRTTNGWRNYQSDHVSEGWTVRDGALIASKKAGDLITNDEYGNFELSIEYRISQGGNSGLLFHVSEDGKKAWHSGPEIQLLDNARHRAKEKSGWLYQLYRPVVPDWSVRARAAAGVKVPASVDATRPAGQWNHIYLRVCEAQSEVVVNGVGYYRFNKGSEDWEQRVGKSKFSKFPQFGKAKSGHICLQEHGNIVAFRNIKLRQLNPDGNVQQQPIDGKLPLKGVVAFPNLQWEGWEAVDDDGRNRPLRFMELTHAGDDRLFAVAQKGQVFAFKNDLTVTNSHVFLDITDRVAPWTKRNEEGLLGLAFHPNYQQNGKFYIYYSLLEPERTCRISEFHVSVDDPNRADVTSERVLLEIAQPFHNHNGGSIAFGQDGYLYIGLGDGGDRNDPLGSGQDVDTLLGSVLRIDVNGRADGKPYAIPKDNPFVDGKGRPEIYAFGFRNVWRLSFDTKTNDLWVADVGQDLWEEINIVRRGGNYGWNLREGRHPFGNATQNDSVPEPIEPLWEYDHRIGKSITGGKVYNGSRLPELQGMYLYADYVTGRVWALECDRAARKVKRNLEISAGGITVTAFGEDARGEVYYMIAAANGQCIYRFVRNE